MDQFGGLVESIGFKSQSRSTPLSKLKSQPTPNPPPRQQHSKSNTNHDVFGTQSGGAGGAGGAGGVDLDAFFVGTSSSGFNNDDDVFGFNNNGNNGSNRSFGSNGSNGNSYDDLFFGFDSNTRANNIGGNTATAHSGQSSTPSYIDSSFVEDHFSIFQSSSSPIEKSSSMNSSTIDELEAFAMGSSQNNGSDLGGKISNEDIFRVQEKLSNMKYPGKKGNAASDAKIKVSLPKKDGRESKVTPGNLNFSPMEKVPVREQKNEAKNTFGFDDPFGEWFSNDSQTNSSRGPKSDVKDDILDSLVGGRNQKSNVEKTSSQSSRVVKKPPTNTNHVDDFLFFGEPAPSAVEFHEIDGEPEERRRARYNQHMRTKERMAKALSEKNQRDLQAQHEQEERLRSAESMDSSIKRWAAGKEGNLRALLSSLQDVLWPECGWKTVSLTDMITSISVKKVYHKATLCVHPDKVQQKGATPQQKYIAEKVFDILKESWNKFNAEELR